MKLKHLVLFFCTLTLGIIPTFLLVQADHRVQKLAIEYGKQLLEEIWDTDITLQTGRAHLLSGTIRLAKGVMNPRTLDKCVWRFDTCTMKFSPFGWLLTNIIPLSIRFNHAQITSPLNHGGIAISDHFARILATKPTEPDIQLRSIAMNELTLNVISNDKNICWNGMGTILIKKKSTRENGETWYGRINLVDGSLQQDGTSILHNLTGKARVSYDSAADNYTSSHMFKADAPGHDQLLYRGTWNSDDGEIGFHNTEKSIDIVAHKDTHGVTLGGTIPTNTLTRLGVLSGYLEKQHASLMHDGSVSFDATLQFTPLLLTGTIKSNKVNLFSFPNINTDINIKLEPGLLKARGAIQGSLGNYDFAGNLNTNTNVARGTLTNNSLITLPNSFTTIPSKSLKITLAKSHDNRIKATYSCALENDGEQQQSQIDGTFSMADETIKVNGTTSKGTYGAQATLQQPCLHQLWYKQNSASIIELEHDESSGHLKGTIAYKFLKTLLPPMVTSRLLGSSGVFHIDIDQSDYPTLTGALHMKDSSLYLYGSLNLLRELKADLFIDINNRSCELHNCMINLHKGVIESPKIRASWDNSFALHTLHAPLTIDKTLINWKHDFYGIINGTMNLSKKEKGPLVTKGSLILVKSLLKENIFSNAAQDSFYNPFAGQAAHEQDHYVLDVSLLSQQPLKAKTSFLDADVHVDLGIKFNSQTAVALRPTFAGTINLEKGSLKFTHHTLWITQGTLRFVPNNLNQALIDLTATNKIKKYQITLRAMGDMQRPTILLESMPLLTQEQIIALLFAGSENATLQADLPAMLMQNLDRMVIGNKQIQPQAKGFFEKISKSFKYLAITPHFTDQTGRGGIRGALNIKVNDHFHARLEKNFNLQEDFVVQLEFIVNDDFNIKLTRDQRGDLGSELELRLKM